MDRPPNDGSTTGIGGFAGLTATWFGVGRLPGAPGTWGSLVALPLAWILAVLGGPLWLAAAALVVLAVGLWAAESYERGTGRADAPEVVIDEVAGQWIALLFVPPDPVHYGLGFLLFRAFDILKPWPISWAERRLPGGWGVMADDVLAGAFAALLALAIRNWLGDYFVLI
jgi:phosphatidylglycerophosphatase A